MQVVGNEDVVGDEAVISEGDVGDEGVVGDEGDVGNDGVVGDEGGKLNELVCYGWMNDEFEGLDFTDDIFGGNEGHWKTRGS